jgi:lipoate-protein ligase B
LIETLAAFGVTGRRIEGQPGIWAGEADRDAKIASIGLRVTRGVSYHGVSINVTAESKAGFAHIVTCGVRDQKVTSIEDEIADPSTRPRSDAASAPVTVDDASTRFCEALTKRLTDFSSST